MDIRDRTTKDVVAMRSYLVSLVDKISERVGSGSWTDHNESDVGMVYLELAAGLTDMLNFYLDKQALENYLPTVTTRKNLKRIVSLLGYRLRGLRAGYVDAVFTLSRHLDFDFTIPKYFQVSYSRPGRGNVYYATVDEVQFRAGQTAVAARLVQGVVNVVHMTLADVMRDRTVTLDSNRVAEGSITVSIGGEEWEQVTDVLVDDEYGPKFSVYEDEDDHPVIEFGYSYRHFVPLDDPLTPVEIKYLVTEGAHGRVAAGKLDTIESNLEVNGYDVASLLGISSLTDATGGFDREDMEEARISAPHVRHSPRRLTTLRDYRDFCESVEGVLSAKVVDWKTEGGYVYVPYQISIYVLPSEYGEYVPDPEFLAAIREAMEPYLWCSIDLSVHAPKIRDIDIKLIVETNTRKLNYTGLRQEIRDLYTTFFEKERRSFGERFTLRQLGNIAMQSNLVNSVSVTTPSEVIELAPNEFPRLNKIEMDVVGSIL